MSRYNSRGKLIEELDTPIYQIDVRGPFQSPKPVSPKRKPTPQTFFESSTKVSFELSDNEFDLYDIELDSSEETSAKPSVNTFEPDEQKNLYANLRPQLSGNLSPPFLNADEAEILAWCEAYQNLKKKGINIYKI